MQPDVFYELCIRYGEDSYGLADYVPSIFPLKNIEIVVDQLEKHDYAICVIELPFQTSQPIMPYVDIYPISLSETWPQFVERSFIAAQDYLSFVLETEMNCSFHLYVTNKLEFEMQRRKTLKYNTGQTTNSASYMQDIGILTSYQDHITEKLLAVRYKIGSDNLITNKASFLQEQWVLCHECSDAWEVNSEDPIVECPSCEERQINPLYQMPATS